MSFRSELSDGWPILALMGLVVALFAMPLAAATLISLGESRAAEACAVAGNQWVDGDCLTH